MFVFRCIHNITNLNYLRAMKRLTPSIICIRYRNVIVLLLVSTYANGSTCSRCKTEMYMDRIDKQTKGTM